MPASRFRAGLFIRLGLVLIFRPTGLLGERVSDRA
jgi:hypothetical protein